MITSNLRDRSSVVGAQVVVPAPGSLTTASGPMTGSDGGARAAATTESFRTGNRRPGTVDRFGPSTDEPALNAETSRSASSRPSRFAPPKRGGGRIAQRPRTPFGKNLNALRHSSPFNPGSAPGLGTRRSLVSAACTSPGFTTTSITESQRLRGRWNSSRSGIPAAVVVLSFEEPPNIAMEPAAPNLTHASRGSSRDRWADKNEDIDWSVGDFRARSG